MTPPRTPKFWIALTACGLSICLCLTSIVLGGRLSVVLLASGVALFLPASVNLASQVSGRPLVDRSPPVEQKKRPIYDAVFLLLMGCFWAGQNFALTRRAGLDVVIHRIFGAAAVVAAAVGGFRLVIALVRHYRTRFTPRP
jgi:hypothetical protein